MVPQPVAAHAPRSAAARVTPPPPRPRPAPSTDERSTATEPGGPVTTVRLAAHLTPDDLADWRALDDASEVAVNPFLGPDWVLSWYESFVPDPVDRLLVLVRHPGTGALLGIAPMHREALKVGPVTVARRLVPVGAATYSAYELPGFLAAPGQHREVMRRMVSTVLASGGAWGALTLGQEQGWFEPEHLMVTRPVDAGEQVDFWQHTRTRACVVLPLQPTWEQTSATLKRNLKESLRRSRNRLAKSGHRVEVVRRSGAELDRPAVERFLALHALRAANEQAGVEHADSYGQGRNRELMLTALPRLGSQERASLFELRLDGELVAAQLALHAHRSSYVHSSGFKPEVWSFGPVTHLVGELVRHAVERGDRVVNFSPGPRVAKLRWSEQIWVSHEFAFGLGPRRTLRRYLALRAASAWVPEKSGVEYTVHAAPEAPGAAAPAVGGAGGGGG